jgi:hypothetical protein
MNNESHDKKDIKIAVLTVVNKRLKKELTEIKDSLEEFRYWLATEIGDAGGIGAISDEPITTCLTVAKARINVLRVLFHE